MCSIFSFGCGFLEVGEWQGERLSPCGCGVSSCHGYMAAVCSSVGPYLVQSYIHSISSGTFVLPNINI